MAQPLRVLILRLNNDVTHEAVERVLKAVPCAYAANLGTDERYYGALPRADQRWFDSRAARGGVYEGVVAGELLPTDEALIEAMRPVESQFMHVLTRLEYARSIPYAERKRIYLWHLRVWNDFLERQKINLLVSGIIPHEIPDCVVYGLCKVKGIRTLMFHSTPIRDTAFLMDDWRTNGIQAQSRYAELLRELRDAPMEKIPLGPTFEDYFRKQSQPSGKGAITFHRPNAAERIVKYVRNDLVGAMASFVRWLPSLVSPAAWHRRGQRMRLGLQVRRLRRFYDAHAVQPDFEKPFIYVPLHFQPECSTSPMAGAFVDQLVTVQLLAATLPSGVLLYVKEHPKQIAKGYACRSIAFYRQLLAIPNVRLMAGDTDSFALREHCKAVATATGTAGLEGLFREKPVLMFGHHFYQYAPGIFTIRTREDCARAMGDIFTKGAKPDLRLVRIFLKAVEGTCVRASLTIWHQTQASDLTPQQNIGAISEALLKELKA